MKVFSTSVGLNIVRATGGRWPFELQLEATEPEPDDTIVVEASLKTTATITFRLLNRFPNFAPFQAFFSADSSSALAVTPATGLLGPGGGGSGGGGGGTALNVSFSPLEYGLRQRGRLVVLTEDTQWTYEVVGEKPKDRVPTNAKSVVETYQPLMLSAQRKHIKDAGAIAAAGRGT